MIDVCVIGAGAGGAVAATELSLAGLRVTLLEKGRAYAPTEFTLGSPTWETDPLPFEEPAYEGEAHVMAVEGIGGSTLRYQAVARRLAVPWAPNDAYDRVEQALGVTRHPLSYASRFAQQAFDRLGLHLEPAPTAIRPTCNHCAGCTYGCPIGAKSSVDLAYLVRAKELEIVPRASVFRLERSGRVTAALYHDGEGRERRVEARVFVLSAGVLGTPRLLLLSAIPAGEGIMQSLRASLTLLCEDRLGSYRGVPIDALCADFEDRGILLGISQSAQGLLGPVAYAKRLAPIVRGAHQEFMKRYFGNALGLFATAGQAPRASNRITLATRKDRFGVPLPKLELSLDDGDRARVEELRKRLAEIAAAVPRSRIVERFSSIDSPPGGAELRGGCAGIVDESGRVRGIPNLYIADASVFPAAGPGNPSLTIMAMATRTAERIARERR